MDTSVLGKIVVALTKVPQYWGLLLDVIVKVSDSDFARELAKFARHEPCWVNYTILELVSTVVVPATTSKFIAKDRFVLGTGLEAKAKIYHISPSFREWFLLGDGKTEGPIGKRILCCAKLKPREGSLDGPIIDELGGEEKSETTLSEIFSLMEKHRGNAGEGCLLSEDAANVFYVNDQKGFLRGVFVYWYVTGWCVDALPVGSPYGQRAGCQVFYCNSLSSVPQSSTPKTSD